MNQTRHYILRGALALLPASLALGQDKAAPAARLEATCQADPTTRFQVIDHFGANDCWTIQVIGQWSDPGRRKVAELLFSQERGIGLSLWRVNLGSGPDQHIADPLRAPESYAVAPGVYDWSRQPGSRWFLRAAKEYGVPQFLAFCNSPPIHLTRNSLTNHGDDKANTTNLKPGAEAEFARYLVDILAHFSTNPDPAERVVFDGISPINEPQWDWTGNSQEGCRYSNADIRPVVLALGKELASRGLPTRIHLVESGYIGDLVHLNDGVTRKYRADYGNYIDLLCGDPDIAPLLHHTLGYHSYWSVSPDQLVAKRTELRRKLDAWPGWSVWQTEFCIMEHKRDLGMATALRVAEVIHADLTIANAGAWDWWEAVSQADYKDGLIFTDYHQPGDAETVYPSKTLWTLGHYARFVRPGMQRIDLRADTTAPTGLLLSAYSDAAAKRFVLVCTNLGKQPIALRASVLTQPDRPGLQRWTPYLTSPAADDNLRLLPTVPVGDAVTLPAQSVMTLVGG